MNNNQSISQLKIEIAILYCERSLVQLSGILQGYTAMLYQLYFITTLYVAFFIFSCLHEKGIFYWFEHFGSYAYILIPYIIMSFFALYIVVFRYCHIKNSLKETEFLIDKFTQQKIEFEKLLAS